MSNTRVLQLVAPAVKGPDNQRGVNGPERRALNTVNDWQKHDVTPVIYYPKDGKLYNEFKKSPNLTLVEGALENKFNFKILLDLYKIIKQERITTIHSQGPGSLDAYAIFLGLISRTRVIITRPFGIFESTPSKLRGFIYFLIDFFTLHLADHVIFVSEKVMKEEVSRYGLKKAKVSKVWNGINLSRFNKINQEAVEEFKSKYNPENKITIMIMAQLTVPKNHTCFIDVIAELHKKGHTNIVGLIVGDGPLRQDLEAYAAKKGISETIQFTGNLTDTTPALMNSDICLFTSKREGLSVALIETLAAGIPIISFEVGGIREQVIDKENGYIIPNYELDTMVKKTEELITSSTLRSTMGQTSKEIANTRFSQATMVASYASLYKGSHDK